MNSKFLLESLLVNPYELLRRVPNNSVGYKNKIKINMSLIIYYKLGI